MVRVSRRFENVSWRRRFKVTGRAMGMPVRAFYAQVTDPRWDQVPAKFDGTFYVVPREVAVSHRFRRNLVYYHAGKYILPDDFERVEKFGSFRKVYANDDHDFMTVKGVIPKGVKAVVSKDKEIAPRVWTQKTRNLREPMKTVAVLSSIVTAAHNPRVMVPYFVNRPGEAKVSDGFWYFW